jgi:N-acetyltransferase
VTGCVVAHPIKVAYKMLDSVIEGCDCCSEESYPVKCGVSRIWVAKNYRRKKTASRIMDCMRYLSIFIQYFCIYWRHTTK